MELKIIDRDSAPLWNRYVGEHEHAIAWHNYEWSDLVGKHFNTVFYPLAVMMSSSICGILPLFKVKTLTGGVKLISVPHAVAGGALVNGSEEADILLNRAVAMTKDLGASALILKQYKVQMPGELKTDAGYYNRELDLSGGTERLWDSLSELNKNELLSERKEGLVLDHPFEEINTFYKILLGHHHRRGIPCVSRSWIRDLINLGWYEVAVIRRGERILAATMTKTFRDTVSFPFTCLASDDRESINATYHLYWQLIRKYSENGFRIFHSGRIPDDDQTETYRLGWGGKKHPYFYQYYPDRGQKTESGTKQSSKRRYFEAVWRKAPRSMARILGPAIVRQFP